MLSRSAAPPRAGNGASAGAWTSTGSRFPASTPGGKATFTATAWTASRRCSPRKPGGLGLGATGACLGKRGQTPQEGAGVPDPPAAPRGNRACSQVVSEAPGVPQKILDLALCTFAHTHAKKSNSQPSPRGCWRLVLTGRRFPPTRTCERDVLLTHKCGWFFSVKCYGYFDSL